MDTGWDTWCACILESRPCRCTGCSPRPSPAPGATRRHENTSCHCTHKLRQVRNPTLLDRMWLRWILTSNSWYLESVLLYSLPLWCLRCRRILTVVSEAPLRCRVCRLRPRGDPRSVDGVALTERPLTCSAAHWSTECLLCFRTHKNKCCNSGLIYRAAWMKQ